MATRQVGAGPTPSRSTTAASSRRARRKNGPVRCWSECSVTISVSNDPPQFIKFTHGFEMMSPTDDEDDIRRTEFKIYKTCEEIVDKRVKRLARLIKQINA